ncbi:hypothetical protein H4W34_002086 [Actinomadura algeriensis]|uniref:Uncharacterized protein n=1 Tax=Actinomadura algeriensis TaxID=1679523 RepID=A0ABR9JNV9_9ACTN|nr:hypothetical protein [Actinomadura algeriensis]
MDDGKEVHLAGLSFSSLGGLPLDAWSARTRPPRQYPH